MNFLSNAIKFTPVHGTIEIETIMKESQNVMTPIKAEDDLDGIRSRPTMSLLDFAKHRKAKSLTTNSLLRKLQSSKSIRSIETINYVNFEIRIKDSGYGISEENI